MKKLQNKAFFLKYSPDLKRKIWRTEINSGQWPGGQYQFAGLENAPSSMVNTECWGMTKTFDLNGKHNGYALACGSGMMACGLSVQPPASSLKIYYTI